MKKSLIIDDDGGVIRALSQGDEELFAAWRLVYYPPFARLGFHDHDVAHFSALLCGQAQETTNAGEFALRPMLMEFKPAGFRHANEFGPDGALMLSINVTQNNQEFDAAFPPPEWLMGDGRPVHQKWASLANIILTGAANADTMETITFDLLSAISDRNPDSAPSAPPLWLKRVREAVIETDAPLKSIALDAGVHRAHLSRAFRRHYGRTVSECRREARLARAVRLMARDGATATSASYAAGFSDQSHFTRVMRQQFGVTPGALKTGLAAV